MTFYHLPTSTERGPGRLETKLSDAKVTLDTITGTAALALTQADLRALQQQVKDLARIQKRLVRLALRQFDSQS